MPDLIMLGPQQPRANLGAAVAVLHSPDEPAAVITAGWQDAEGEIEEMQDLISRPLVDLKVNQRAEDVFDREPALRRAHRKQQKKLKELQRLYLIRLQPAMATARRLLHTQADPDLLKFEQRAAIEQVRSLDRHHLHRITAIHDEFQSRLRVQAFPILAAGTELIRQTLKACSTVIIAGGHVAVLLNRMRLFGLGPMLHDKQLIAWSAGAMALCDRIVLFHDTAAHGKRDAEVFDTGLGLVTQVVPLPDARHRIDYEDRTRLALFSRRFAPSRCLTLDNGSLLKFASGRVVSAHNVGRISHAGRSRVFQAA